MASTAKSPRSGTAATFAGSSEWTGKVEHESNETLRLHQSAKLVETRPQSTANKTDPLSGPPTPLSGSFAHKTTSRTPIDPARFACAPPRPHHAPDRRHTWQITLVDCSSRFQPRPSIGIIGVRYPATPAPE